MPSSDALDATVAIKTAIISALLSNTTLNNALQGLKIVDDAPSSHPTPYIEIDTRSDDWSTATEDGQAFAIDLHVWHQPSSRTPETAAARDVMALVRQTLHTATLTLAAPFNCVLVRVENMVGPFRDPDGTTMHGVVSVRALVDHS